MKSLRPATAKYQIVKMQVYLDRVTSLFSDFDLVKTELPIMSALCRQYHVFILPMQDIIWIACHR